MKNTFIARLFPTLILLFSLLLPGCQAPDSQQAPVYFPIREHLIRSIQLNTASQPTFKKIIQIDGKADTLITNKIRWDKELEPFMQLDINKPAFRKSFEVAKVPNGVVYTARPGERTPVQQLRLTFDAQNRMRTLAAHIKTDNFLYNSGRDLAASFMGDTLIKYQVTGWQQLFIGSKTHIKLISVRNGLR